MNFPIYIVTYLATVVMVIFGAALVMSYLGNNETLQTQMFTGAYGLANLAAGYFFAKIDKTTTTVAAPEPNKVKLEEEGVKQWQMKQ